MEGKIPQAQSLYAEVLAISPTHAGALHLLGVTAAQMGDQRKAVELIGKAISLNPENEEFHFNRGLAFHELKEFSAAVSCFEKATGLKQDYCEAYCHRGNALQELYRFEEAVDGYDQAVAIRPDYLEAYYRRGNALQELGRFDEAAASYDQAIAIKPDFAEAFSNRGNALQKLERYEAATESFEKAIAINPGIAQLHYNRANALKKLRRFDAALASYDRAIAIKPDYPEAFNNRGLLLQELNLLDAAIASFDAALAVKDNYHDARLHKSLALLLRGEFAQGWELYESRWQTGKLAAFKRDFRQPLWLGCEPIAGKTILLHSEQGFGDSIQFCRYARSVADLGARVVLEAEVPLAGLFESLAGVSELVARGETLPDFDCHSPLMSLPLAFRTDINSIPCPRPYLKSDPYKMDRWKSRIGAETKPLAGLAWSGNAAHTNDAGRSIPLSRMIRHLPPGLAYVSLQKEVRKDDRETLDSHPNILDFGDELNDFSDTAALCELMDIVISVDTGVAHLGGALGRPTWVLLPFSPDWRWLLDRDDSPWYPSMRLFRQQEPDDWKPVLEMVGRSLMDAYGS
ncbi:MAG TPA: tetratricopeptide repeat protein [Chlorobaculum sp.]|nr:tetratricopeptide repeat protein [Chlorobaculum sp.]